METPARNLSDFHFHRNLEPGDIGTITSLHGILYAREYHWDYTFEGYVAEGLAKFALSYDSRKDGIWIAEAGGQIAGSIFIVGRSAEEAQLRWFLVHPDFRGKGLGRRLLSEALQFCRQRSYKTIYLWTVHGLEAAAHLYRDAGFHKTEEKTHLQWGAMITEERYDLTL